MGLSIKNTIKQTFTPDVVKKVSEQLGETKLKTERAVHATWPALVEHMSAATETDDGLLAIEKEIDGANTDLIKTFEKRFVDTPNILIETGRSTLKRLFPNDKGKAVIDAVAAESGVGTVSAEMLAGTTAPLVMSALAKHRDQAGLSAAGLQNCLREQLKEVPKAKPVFASTTGESESHAKPFAWSSLLFPLLALLGLIILGVSLFKDRGVGTGKKGKDDIEIVQSDGSSEGGSNANNAASSLAEESQTGSGDVANGGGAPDGDKDGAKSASSAHSKDGDHTGNTDQDGDAHADNDKDKDSPASKLASRDKSKDGEHADQDGDAHLNGDKDKNGQASKLASNDKAKDGDDGEADIHVGKDGDDAHDGDTHTHDGDTHTHDGDTHTHDGHAADSASAAAAAAAASTNKGKVTEQVALKLPAAVSKATRILNGIENADQAREAVEPLGKITKQIGSLRGEQKRWPQTTQRLVRQRLFAMMPSFDHAIAKMIDNEDYLSTLEKPLGKLIGEIDRLVPER